MAFRFKEGKEAVVDSKRPGRETYTYTIFVTNLSICVYENLVKRDLKSVAGLHYGNPLPSLCHLLPLGKHRNTIGETSAD